MSPEVVARKLGRMSQYMAEFLPYRQSPYEAFWADHHKVERLIELLVMSASDIAIQLLDSRGEPPPSSYRSAFLQAGRRAC